MKEKSAQIFAEIKYQKKFLNGFTYQWYWLIFFLEKIKTIILEYI